MLRIVVTTFLMVFVAELGDKTQLATMMLAAETSNRWAVFAGAALALVASSFVGVVGGAALNRLVPQSYLNTGAAVSFILVGIFLLLGRL